MEDWESYPFVDIDVVDQESQCKKGYEPLLRRLWPGTYDLTTCESESRLDCKNSDIVRKGSSAIDMTKI